MGAELRQAGKQLHENGAVLVLAQFSLLFFLALPVVTPRKGGLASAAAQFPAAAAILAGAALIILIWSVAAMRRSRLRIRPEPAADTSLVTSGPYKFVRHPMYTAVLLGASSLLLVHLSWPRVGALLALTVVLVLKLRYEEKLLSNRFPGYAAYRSSTFRLVPFIY